MKQYAKQYYDHMEKELDRIDSEDLRLEIAKEGAVVYTETVCDQKEAELYEEEFPSQIGSSTQ